MQSFKINEHLVTNKTIIFHFSNTVLCSHNTWFSCARSRVQSAFPENDKDDLLIIEMPSYHLVDKKKKKKTCDGHPMFSHSKIFLLKRCDSYITKGR